MSGVSEFDIVVIGAGIAGASAAALLAAHRRVALVEREEALILLGLVHSGRAGVTRPR